MMPKHQSHLIVLATATLLMALGGCGDKEKPGEPAAPKGEKTQAQKQAAATALQAPPTVVVFGGTQDLQKTLQDLNALANQVAPGQIPPLDQMVAPALQGELRLKDASAVDAKKPLRFAVIDPKKHRRDPTALLIGITDKDAFVKALPDNKQENQGGNAWMYPRHEGDKRPIYINFVDGYAAVTRDEGIFPAHKDFLAQLAAADMPAPAVAYVEVDHLMALYGDQFKKNLAEIRKAAAEAAKATPGGGQQVEVVGAMFDWIAQAAGELDQAQVSLTRDAEGAQLRFAALPKAGSALAGNLTALKAPGRSGMLARLPADSVVAITADLDPKKMAEMSEALTRAFVIAPIFGGDEAKAKPYADAMRQYLAAISGEMAFAVHGAPGGDGLAMSAVFGVTDAAAARTAQQKLAGMYGEPEMQGYYKQLGVQMELKAAAYKVGDVEVDIIQTGMGEMPPEAAPMADMLSAVMTQHVAIGKDLGVIAYGEDAQKVIEMYLGGQAPGGLDKGPAIQRARKVAAPGEFMLISVNPIELGKRLKLGGMNPLAGTLAGIESKTGLTISSGVEGSTLHLVIDVPVELVKSGMTAFEKSKGSF